MSACIDQFNDGEETLVLANPAADTDKRRIVEACEKMDLSGSVVIATSGSSGRSRWVVLSRDSLRGSARAVNAHLEISPSDMWICALPVFHVGGLSVHIRAKQSGSKVVSLPGKWDPLAFVEQCNNYGVTLSSLVPTQLFDLMNKNLSVPQTLRGLIIGGAALDPQLCDRAIEKGWPVLKTYGMSEAGSQIATQPRGGSGMELLDCWDARLSDDSVLEIRGENLFSGYLENQSTSWDFTKPMDSEGWFSTGDITELSGRMLQVTGRSDAMVKVLGERVELDMLQARLESIAGKQVAVSAVADERRGYQLVLVYEEGVSQRDVLDRYNQDTPGPERIGEGFEVKQIPRNALGKLRRGKIVDIVNSRRRGVPES